jgi:hypothetical protein
MSQMHAASMWRGLPGGEIFSHVMPGGHLAEPRYTLHVRTPSKDRLVFDPTQGAAVKNINDNHEITQTPRPDRLRFRPGGRLLLLQMLRRQEHRGLRDEVLHGQQVHLRHLPHL